MDLPTRKNVRLPNYDYASPGGYFITICAFEHMCIFGKISDGEMKLNQFGNIVHEYWQNISNVYSHIDLDEFIVMPNHMHGIILINKTQRATQWVAPTTKSNGAKTGSIGVIIGQFKSIITKHINKIQKPNSTIIWQRNYYEHIIRNDTDLIRIRKYIHGNPEMWDQDEYNKN